MFAYFSFYKRKKIISFLKQPKLYVELVHTLSHYTKTNKKFDIIKYIRLIYDIFELLKVCKNCGNFVVAPTGCGRWYWALFSNFVLDALL